MRKVFGIVLLAAFGMLVFFITREAYQPEASGTEVSSTILLERVRPVLKLVTVEGDFSELYTFKKADASFEFLKQFTAFQKQAIVRVQGKASIGYDLEGMELTFDTTTHTVRLTGMDKPKLLSLEHDMDYYDLEAGAFNSFTAADMTRINAESKQLISNKINSSGLYEAAATQRDQMLAVMRAVIENSGWNFEDNVSPRDGRSRLNVE
ncbi:MAG: DUF4230 domain-containing protein [Flavobacteriales bacterium]